MTSKPIWSLRLAPAAETTAERTYRPGAAWAGTSIFVFTTHSLVKIRVMSGLRWVMGSRGVRNKRPVGGRALE